MKPEIKKKWVEALRSGKYEQGRGFLRAKANGKDQFCCLGVLCDLIQPNKWEDRGGGIFAIRSVEGTPFVGTLPMHVRDTAGITFEDQGSLSIKNDEGMSFERIAEYIEKNL